MWGSLVWRVAKRVKERDREVSENTKNKRKRKKKEESDSTHVIVGGARVYLEETMPALFFLRMSRFFSAQTHRIPPTRSGAMMNERYALVVRRTYS